MAAHNLIPTGEATAMLPLPNDQRPITVIGNEAIRATFDDACLAQAVNAAMATGVSRLVLNPDAHIGYGAPVGCVLSSPTHIYPGPVGVDIKCSMSLLALDIKERQVEDKRRRRELIDAILERTPTGAGQGQRNAKKARHVDEALGEMLVTEGASKRVCEALGIPPEWAERCEDSAHVGHDGTADALRARLDRLRFNAKKGDARAARIVDRFGTKMRQLGSYGGGNHFGECEVVRVAENERARAAAEVFGLRDGGVAFLSHCGSRGFGHDLASGQFALLAEKFEAWGTPLPGGDKNMVYAPLGSPEANDYLDDMALGANFATVNHLLINALVLEAFQEVIPNAGGHLVYFISHNIARQEVVNNRLEWVHRKGATRAFPGGHHALKGDAVRTDRPPDPAPGQPAGGLGGDGGRGGGGGGVFQCESRRGPSHGPPAGDASTRPESGRRLVREGGHHEQLPQVPAGRSARSVQGLPRGRAVGRAGGPREHRRAAGGPLRHQGCRQGG